MVIEAACGRRIREIVGNLLAYQRHEPIDLRIVSPVIHDAHLSDEEMFSQKIAKLITYKSANITIVVCTKRKRDTEEEKVLKRLENFGAKIHRKKDLHAKIILLEGGNDKAVLVSSANLTPSGLGRQVEAGIYILNELTEVYDRIYQYVTNVLKVS